MRKHGMKRLIAALAVVMTVGNTVCAYAGPGGPGAAPETSGSSGVIVAGQTRTEESAGGPGGASSGVQTVAPGQSVSAPAAAPGSQEPQGQTQGQGIFAPVDNNHPANQLSNGVIIENQYGSAGQIINTSMKLNGVGGMISYGVYVNNGGYLPWMGEGRPAGGTEESTYVEAIQIALTGEAAELYNVYYRGVSAHAGQHGWATNQELMGTIDRGDYLTSIEVCLIPKADGAPGSYEGRFYSNHSEYINVNANGSTYANGYTGWVDHDRARYYFQNGQAVTGWQYIDGLKYYFNQSGALIMDVDDMIGRQSSYVLKVNKELNCLTVYAKDGDNGYIIPVKAMLTSVGDDTPVGTFHTPEKYRWRFMVNETYTQWATRIIAGQGFLLHSITYEKQDANTLISYGYNMLGVTRSLGCVRLTAANAKWVYDNCPVGTEITIYNDASNPGPFFKPYQVWIPSDQTYDPTDPAFN